MAIRIGGHDFINISRVLLGILFKFGGQWCITSGETVVGCALKHGQMLGRRRNHRRGLNARGASADERDSLAGKVYTLMWPLTRVIPLAFKVG